MLPSSCAISFAYNAKCYAFLHTQQQKYASKHLRADSFAQQDFLCQEGSVCEHRKTNWWFALHSERKGKGKNRGRADKVHQGKFNRWTWLLQLQI